MINKLKFTLVLIISAFSTMQMLAVTSLDVSSLGECRILSNHCEDDLMTKPYVLQKCDTMVEIEAWMEEVAPSNFNDNQKELIVMQTMIGTIPSIDCKL